MKRLFLRLFRLLYWAGIPRVFRFVHRHSLTIVLYHGVAPARPQGIYNYRGKFIDPIAFERQIKYIQRHYTVLPLAEALDRMQDGSLPHNALAITFDDGYRNFYEYAYPVLVEHGLPSTMYLATDFVCRNMPLWVDRLEHAMGAGEGSVDEKRARDARERDRLKSLTPEARETALASIEADAHVSFNSFETPNDVYAPLTAAQIRESALHGVSYGAHTKSHPILARQTASVQRDEILGSRHDIETLGVPVSPVFAYPNGQGGDWNDDTETVLKEAGFTHALTTREGFNTAQDHPYRLKRIVLDATADIPAFAIILTGVRLFVKSIL